MDQARWALHFVPGPGAGGAGFAGSVGQENQLNIFSEREIAMPLVIGRGFNFDRFVPVHNLQNREHVIYDGVPWRVKKIYKILTRHGRMFRLILEHPRLKDVEILRSPNSMIRLAHNRNLKFQGDTNND